MKKSAILAILILFLGCQAEKERSTILYATESVQEPVPFAPGVISTEENSEFQIMFTPDGRTAYFSRRAPDEKQKIYNTTFENGVWSEPKLSSFSTDRDETPSMTPDGNLFFFGSERPIPSKQNQGNFDMNIWMMKKDGDGWGEPEPLPYPINDVQVEGEQWPSSNNNLFMPISNDTFYYTTMVRGSDAIKLFQVTYKNDSFSQPKEISGLFDDSKYWIYSPAVSPDGKYLIFNSYDAPGGSGGEDLYISKKRGNSWSKAKPLTFVNTKNEESSPNFSRDGKYFFFSTAENLGNYEYGEWGIYFVETEFLQLQMLFK